MKKLALVLAALAVFASIQQASAQGDNRTVFFLQDISKTKARVDKYVSPEHQISLVDAAGEDWLFRAVSKIEREKWLKTTQFSPEQSKQINDALDALAAAAAPKFPVFKPLDKIFAYGTPEEKEMLKGKINDIQTVTIYKIGLADEVWQVVKDNTGTPKYRWKAGYVWARNNNKTVTDHPYCRILNINITQNYQGAGTYGASFAGFQHSLSFRMSLILTSKARTRIAGLRRSLTVGHGTQGIASTTKSLSWQRDQPLALECASRSLSCPIAASAAFLDFCLKPPTNLYAISIASCAVSDLSARSAV